MGRRIPPGHARPTTASIRRWGRTAQSRPSARPGDSCCRGRRPGHRRGRRPTCPARARPPSTCTARSAAWPRVVSDSRETAFVDCSWGPASTTCMLSFQLVEGDSMAPVVIPIRSRLRQGSRSASLTTLEESLDTGRIPGRRMRDQRRRFPPQSPNGQEARDVVVGMGEPGSGILAGGRPGGADHRHESRTLPDSRKRRRARRAEPTAGSSGLQNPRS